MGECVECGWGDSTVVLFTVYCIVLCIDTALQYTKLNSNTDL